MADPIDPTLLPPNAIDQEDTTDAEAPDFQIPDPLGEALGLADPSYAPNTNTKISLEGVDFTEPNQADISRHSRQTLGQYLSNYSRHGRPGSDTKSGNTYYPPFAEGTSIAPGHYVGSEIPSPPSAETGVSQFVDQGTVEQISSTGLGVGKGLHTPGNTGGNIDGDPGQAIGTFFTSEQIKVVLDKTGGTPNKLGSQLSQKIQAINEATKDTLSEGNRYEEAQAGMYSHNAAATEISNYEVIKPSPEAGPVDTGLQVVGAMPEPPLPEDKGVYKKDSGRVTIQKLQEDMQSLVKETYTPSQLGADPTKPKEKNVYRPNKVVAYEASLASEIIQESAEDGAFYTEQNENITGKSSVGTPDEAHRNLTPTTDMPLDPMHHDDLILFDKTKVGPGGIADIIKKITPSTTALPLPGETVGDTYGTIYDGADPLVKETLTMLKEYNLYSPSKGSPFFKGGSKNEEIATQGLFTIQRELGKFVSKSPGDDTTTLTNPASGKKVTVTDMGAMALALMTAATGDSTAAEELINSSLDFAAQDAASAAVWSISEQMGFMGVPLQTLTLNGIPSADEEAYLGARADLVNSATGNKQFMESDDTGSDIGIRGLKGPSDDPNLPTFVSRPYNATSFGQLNNFFEPFAGAALLGSTGMLIIAIAAILIILAAGMVIELLSFKTEGDGTMDANIKDVEKLAFGRRGAVGNNAGASLKEWFLQSYLGIPKTDYDFGNCMGGGLCLMVGFPGQMITTKKIKAGAKDMTQLMNFFINLVTTPGFYATFLRSIIMSIHVIEAGFRQMFTGGLEGFFAAWDMIINSKLWKFLMTSASLGDANLKSYFGLPGVNTTDTLMQLKPNVEFNKAPNPDQIIKGNDITTTTPENYAIVAGLRKNLTRWGNTAYKNPLSLSTFLATSIQDKRVSLTQPVMRNHGLGQISDAEKALDAEYVPFYFHDLRTGEMISAPAFITSIDESYNVQYNSVDGYGRQDPVRMHQKTERTINMAFKLVAFGKSDHEALWYTVNKLVSMLYPQYSKGVERKIKGQYGHDITFIQPFSQVPSASPLIRIRLGDVIKSNYSYKNMQRMFGYAGEKDDSFKVKNKVDLMAPANEALAAAITVKTTTLKTIARTWAAGGSAAAESSWNAIVKNKLLIHESSASAALVCTTNMVLDEALKIKLAKCATTTEVPDTEAPKTLTLKPGVIARALKAPQVEDATGAAIKAEIEVFPKGKPADKVTLTGVKVALTQFNKVDAVALKKFVAENNENYKTLANAASETDKADFDKSLLGFFDSKHNAIIRSFEVAKGKGLAGFIQNLNINHFDSTWDTDAGSVAPMALEVRLQFLPVHDLPVGLSSDGRLRALTYPVGPLGEKSGWGTVHDKGEINVSVPTGKYNAEVEQLAAAAMRGGPYGPEDEV